MDANKTAGEEAGWLLWAILNKSWRQHPTKHQLCGHLPPITTTIQVRRTRHAGHCWRSRDELINDVHLWTPTYSRAKAGKPARTYIHTYMHTYSSYVRIRDVALKTCRRRWTIGRSGERGSGISGISMMMILFTNPSAQAGYDTKSVFKRSLTGLNSEFFFS